MRNLQWFYFRSTLAICIGISIILCGCNSNSNSSYNFSTSSKATLKSTSLSSRVEFSEVGRRATEPANCTDNVCYTPTSLTGKYFGTGLMIQGGGQGMNAYFGQEGWSSITASSKTYDFDFKTPVTHTGNLVCCAGNGDLTSENTYFSDAIYLFAYLDATFTIPSGSGASGDAIGTHVVRFIFANDVISTAKRGDLMYKDTDNTFKWMDSTTGALSSTRPTSPITMDTNVVNWTNPYGTDKGNQEIPVINTAIAAPASGGVFQVKESELKIEGRTYSYDFPSAGLIFFATVLKTDIGVLSSRQQVLSKIHLQGLPHSKYQMSSSAGTTTLTITEP